MNMKLNITGWKTFGLNQNHFKIGLSDHSIKKTFEDIVLLVIEFSL